MLKSTICKLDQIIGPKQYYSFFWYSVFLYFRSIRYFLVIWFSIYSVLWVWSTVPARFSLNLETDLFKLRTRQQLIDFGPFEYSTSLVFGSPLHMSKCRNLKISFQIVSLYSYPTSELHCELRDVGICLLDYGSDLAIF